MFQRVLCCVLVLASAAAGAWAKDQQGFVTPQGKEFAQLNIPRLEKAPSLSDFAEMKPSPEFDGKLKKVTDFRQREPKDGAPSSQRTEAYLGYTDKNLYVIVVCFDSEMDKIRARMDRRENINEDDQIGFMLDTFEDKQHSYFFYMNPVGVQQDGIFTEQTGNPDMSYDMVWDSGTKLTREGYVAFFEIPFKSLRFPQKPMQQWGFFIERDIPRNNESAFYPHISNNKQGFLSQEGTFTGLESVSPGRNIQLNPYVSFRAFRAVDERDPAGPRFTGKHAEPAAGLDAKMVIKDSFVLDVTVNPDFGQVESDEPQITSNQRFEVFFPEKRPFFLENATYFRTPIDLVFTRRIADPLYGVRLTGKKGGWAIGTLLANDQAPGKSVVESDPLSGREAYYGIVRINRDFGKENTFGFIYTDRELHTDPNAYCTATRCVTGFNRVGGFDTRLKFGSHWLAQAQALTSDTKYNDGSRIAGPSYNAYVQRDTRVSHWELSYNDTAPGFTTATGFFRRPDLRRVSTYAQYRFRREGKGMIWHGPSINANHAWDHSGEGLEWFANANYRWIFKRQTNFGFFANLGVEPLHPLDFTALAANTDYNTTHHGFFFNTAYFKQVSLWGEFNWGQETDYSPAVGAPRTVGSQWGQAGATIRPFQGLVVDNSYLENRYHDKTTGANVYNVHILRSKWNYQFTRELSLRMILQYDALIGNPALTALERRKNVNADLLVTYLVHPGTAVYVGYNSNLSNLDPMLGYGPDGYLRRNRSKFINDGKTIFVKLSYLFRF